MSDRIVHEARAYNHLVSAEQHDSLDQQGHLIAAQVHATLALVEQQSLANRIAVASAIREETVLRTASDIGAWLYDGGGVLGYFSAEEQEALGL